MANFEYEANLTKFLLTKLIFEVLHLLVKNPQFFLLDTNIENLPLIHLPIYKKNFFRGQNKKKFFLPKKNHVFGYSEFIKAGTPKCF